MDYILPKKERSCARSSSKASPTLTTQTSPSYCILYTFTYICNEKENPDVSRDRYFQKIIFISA